MTTEKCVTRPEHTLRRASFPGHIMSAFERATAAIECSAVRCAEDRHRWYCMPRCARCCPSAWCAPGGRNDSSPLCPRTPQMTWGRGSERSRSARHCSSNGRSTPQHIRYARAHWHAGIAGESAAFRDGEPSYVWPSRRSAPCFASEESCFTWKTITERGEVPLPSVTATPSRARFVAAVRRSRNEVTSTTP